MLVTREEILSNAIITECLQEMQFAQVGRDRIGYIAAATEAIANPTQQATILNKLFKDIQKIEGIDFGKIPDSKGDVTKYVYYDAMYDMIELLNKLVDNSPTSNMVTMNKLHQILLDGRADFTFGYRTDNSVIISTYNLMVTTLYDLINVCVIDATEYLRAKLTLSSEPPSAKKIRWIVKSANQFIKMYENGQWALIMKTFKSSGYTLTATEADTDLGSAAAAINARIEVGQGAVNAFSTIKKLPEGLKNVGSSIKSGYGNLSTGVKNSVKVAGAFVALFGLLVLIRKIIYYFYSGIIKIRDALKNNANIIRAVMNVDSNQNQSTIEKQKNMLDILEKNADVIEYKILKSENAANKEMTKSNREEFSKQEISKISGSDFEI